MPWITALTIVGAATTVSGVSGVSMFAQSDTRVLRDAAQPAGQTSHASTSVVRVYSDEQSAGDSKVELPRNLVVPQMLRPLVSSMLDRSPTFRRQCQRIAQTPKVLVRLTLVHALWTVRPRAYTQIGQTADGRLIATVSVTPPFELGELISHEFEHVIEQLDGIDLRARSAHAGSGAWVCSDGSFETTRAIRVGRAVAREMNLAQ